MGTLTVSNSTISDNSAVAGHSKHVSESEGGGIYSSSLEARNTIIAGNTADTSGPDLYGKLSSSGYNLIGDSSGGSGYADTDLLDVDPKLGSLQDNGGPTKTMALLAGSPALNAGDPDQLGTKDQRGVARAGGVNIGAYQASASAFVLTLPDTVTVGTPFDLTVKAVDSFGQVAVGYTGTVTFATDDPNGTVPGDYAFTGDDAGSHAFSGGVTLYADGSRITVTDTADDTLTGSLVVTFG